MVPSDGGGTKLDQARARVPFAVRRGWGPRRLRPGQTRQRVKAIGRAGICIITTVHRICWNVGPKIRRVGDRGRPPGYVRD